MGFQATSGKHVGSVISVGSRMLRTIGLAIAVAGVAEPAWCNVIEIAPNGVVSVYDRPAVVTPDGVEPIEGAGLASDRVRDSGLRAPQAIAHALDRAGSAAGVSPLLLEAIAWTESRFRTDAVSPKGAQGVMQLMPATAAQLGVDPTHRDANIAGGARYLRELLETFNGNLEFAVAAYNAGPNAVRRYRGVPPFPETQAYVAAVMNYLAARADEEPAQ